MKQQRHHMCGKPEYIAWCHMKERCSNSKCRGYENYGGRGITVCNRWDKFANFYEDMGNKPSKKHSLDRKDNEKGYSKDNCRWATSLQQVLNRRKNKNNTSGYVGVTWDKRRSNWVAQVSIDYKHKQLGTYDSPLKAYKAYLAFTSNRELV